MGSIVAEAKISGNGYRKKLAENVYEFPSTDNRCTPADNFVRGGNQRQQRDSGQSPVPVCRSQGTPEKTHLRGAADVIPALVEGDDWIKHQWPKYEGRELSFIEFKREYRPTYNTWHRMRYRSPGGTRVDERIASLRGFFQAFGFRPDPSITLDRINNEDRTYAPELCRWATKKQQAKNRGVVLDDTVTDESGVTKPIVDWAKVSGLTPDTIRKRIKRGWYPPDAISVPLHARGRRAADVLSPQGDPVNSSSHDRRTAGPTVRFSSEAQPLLDVFECEMKNRGRPIVRTTMQAKLLDEIAIGIASVDLDPVAVFSLIVQDWDAYTRYRERHGERDTPPAPKIKVVRGDLSEIVCPFYIDRTELLSCEREYDPATFEEEEFGPGDH